MGEETTKVAAKTQFTKAKYRTEQLKQAARLSERSMSNGSMGKTYRRGASRIPPATQSLSLQCQPRTTNGTVRSLFTNISDHPASINVNHLRSKRTVVTSLGSKEAVNGNSYKARTLVDNWVEEQTNRNNQSDINLINPLHTRKHFTSTQSDSWAESLAEYREKLRTIKMVKEQGSQIDYRSIHGRGKANMIFYSGGGLSANGEVSCPDRTPEYAKGGYWIGTAPVKMYESVGHTYGKEVPPAEVPQGSSKLEFQRRAKWQSPKDRALATIGPVPDNLMARATARHSTSNKFSTSWRSMQQSSYSNYVGHKAAPQLSDSLRSTAVNWTPGTSLVLGDDRPLRSSHSARA